MYYLDFFDRMHELLQPSTYLEIGIRNGGSLRLASCRAVGLDPAFSITVEIDGDIALIRTTSDEYFNRPEPLAPTGGKPFEMAFIDGLHLFEFAFRDFINTERHSTPYSVIAFDDVLPRSVTEAARRRSGPGAWTGDVYPILDVLTEYRPDLSIILVDTQPTGLLLVMGLDPQSTILSDNYDEIVARHRHPDPQPVTEDLMDRLTVLPPERVLEAPFWEVLRTARRRQTDVHAHLAESLRQSLGHAYAQNPS